jgi:rRNA maturation protein Nop10
MTLRDLDVVVREEDRCNNCGGSGEVETPTIESKATLHRKSDRYPFTMGPCPVCGGTGKRPK